LKRSSERDTLVFVASQGLLPLPCVFFSFSPFFFELYIITVSVLGGMGERGRMTKRDDTKKKDYCIWTLLQSKCAWF
jgi:hypothetical protein